MRWKLQNRWYVLLAITFAIGAVLVAARPALPTGLAALSMQIFPDRWSVLIGIYLISIAVSHLFVFYASRAMHVLLALGPDDTIADLWSPALVGRCESVIYPTVFLIGKEEFIGVWLAVKVAGQWVRWGSEAPSESDAAKRATILNEGRRRFNRFLAANALSIGAGALTWIALRLWALRPLAC